MERATYHIVIFALMLSCVASVAQERPEAIDTNFLALEHDLGPQFLPGITRQFRSSDGSIVALEAQNSQYLLIVDRQLRVSCALLVDVEMAGFHRDPARLDVIAQRRSALATAVGQSHCYARYWLGRNGTPMLYLTLSGLPWGTGIISAGAQQSVPVRQTDASWLSDRIDIFRVQALERVALRPVLEISRASRDGLIVADGDGLVLFLIDDIRHLIATYNVCTPELLQQRYAGIPIDVLQTISLEPLVPTVDKILPAVAGQVDARAYYLCGMTEVLELEG